jgi:5-methylcytosine-specific restriction endonuclease McrA
MPYKDPEKRKAFHAALYQAKKSEYNARTKLAKARLTPEQRRIYRQVDVANRRAAEKLTTADVTSIAPEACPYCGGPPQELDHCTPLARGGTNTVDNLVWACAKCNRRKGDRTVLEFLGLWPGYSSSPA